MIFFTSDTHFGGLDTIERENRPFKSCDKFNKYTIKLWNKQSGKNDIIYHLGDFVNYNEKDRISWSNAIRLAKKIKAKVILIIGNNEERVIKYHFGDNFDKFRQFCIDLGFQDVKKEEFLEFNNKKFYLNHFPRKHKDGYINLFGHTHRTTGVWKPFGLNMGCDLNHFYLYTVDEIERLLEVKNRRWDKDEDNLCM